MPNPARTCAAISTGKSGEVAETSEPTASVPTPRKRSSLSPSRVAQSPAVSAAIPAASPETVRS